MTLFCLPFAGGNAYSYRQFEHYFPKNIALVTVELPGHGKRLKEPLLNDLERMTVDIVHQIQERLSAPYAIYGHSMGALLGYLLCRQIARMALAQPLHLFVSGCQGPSVERQEQEWYKLPKQEFIQQLREHGGLPEKVAAETELMDLFLPILRADLQAVADYHAEDAAPLHVPVTVMFALNEGITYEDASQWQRVTTYPIVVKQFSGHHFFVFEHLPEICWMIVQTLENQ